MRKEAHSEQHSEKLLDMILCIFLSRRLIFLFVRHHIPTSLAGLNQPITDGRAKLISPSLSSGRLCLWDEVLLTSGMQLQNI